MPVIDALRGLALAGIVWVNAAYFAAPWGLVESRSGIDVVANWATLAFATGKFFPLFSFLFGMGLGVAAASDDVRADLRMRRRLAALMVCGALHAILLFNGDILLLYGVVGCLVWRMRHAPDRTLVRRAIVAAAVGIVLQSLIMVPWEVTGVPSPTPGEDYLGGYIDTIGVRLRELPYVGLVLLSFNGGFALASILLGVVVGRRGLPVTAGGGLIEPEGWRTLLGGGLVLSAGAAFGLVSERAGFAVGLVSAIVWSVATPLVALGWFCGLWRLMVRWKDSKPVRALACVGSMSMSAYLGHSFLLGALYHGWGLGRQGVFGWAGVVLSAWCVFLLLLASSVLWRSRGAVGPAERAMKTWVNRDFR
ncbi:DUF418 domain-containing protein [Opitutales bacterium ASA1]|uniref:DUF418 domain-containing protein n=1 Tax=Congregicoccus parvus TaxID=3081749 RepID=UPI002B28B5CA|nr:DUF418 domain-containing protein [Opitutales bacterium ASA1]